jgi:predicted SAM-dependent methyltransferase
MVEKTRLNLGCGPNSNPNYLNVDVRKFEGVDVVADLRELKFPSESFTEILVKDVIEHLSFEEAKRLMRKCYGWLKKKGVLVLHTQDIHFLAKALASTGNYDNPFHFEVLKWVYGSTSEGETNYLHGFHRWGYSKESLSKILHAIGFKVVETTTDCSGFGLGVLACKDSLEDELENRAEAVE